MKTYWTVYDADDPPAHECWLLLDGAEAEQLAREWAEEEPAAELVIARVVPVRVVRRVLQVEDAPNDYRPSMFPFEEGL